MWLNKISDIFTNSEHKLLRDYSIACAGAVILAVSAAHILSSNFSGSDYDQDRLKISTVAPGQPQIRQYTEVRSVLDSDIGTGSLTTIQAKTERKSVLDDEISTGSTISAANDLHLDPCKLPGKLPARR